MHTDLKLSATYLPRGQLLRVNDAQGSLVQCLSGTLWLTQQGDARDIVLEAGDEARIERDGLSILSALSDTRFVLSRCAEPFDARRSLSYSGPAALSTGASPTASGPSRPPAWAAT